jgi:hypothetical protein
LLTVSGVKFTCFVDFEPPISPGVVGIEGSALSKLGVLGLLHKVGIEVGIKFVFFGLELGYLRIDLTRSNLPGLCKKFFVSDLGTLTRFAVADF